MESSRVTIGGKAIAEDFPNICKKALWMMRCLWENKGVAIFGNCPDPAKI
ncbi:hypothetical protein [Picosynechococcus sp. PCC 7003]|nr:hypothetical protein [Picosynechococcus sp. PCC 7003]